MPKVTMVTCDSCKKDISNSDYQTLSIRRYCGKGREKSIRLPAIWLCDKCYKRMAMYMTLPPYDVDNSEGT